MDFLHLTEKIVKAMIVHPTLKNLQVVEREGVNYFSMVTIYTLYWFIREHQLEAGAVEMRLRWKEYCDSRHRLPRVEKPLRICAQPGTEVARNIDKIYNTLADRMDRAAFNM